MLKLISAVCLILLAVPAARCGQFALAVKDDGGCAPGYWQFNYGVPQYGRTYSVSIEVDSVQETEERVLKLASSFGATSQAGGGYGYGRGKTKNLSFFAEEPKAEKFAQKIIGEGRLLQYSSNPNMQSTMYAETKKKADLLTEELNANKRALEKMPVASCILGDLRERYLNYLKGYDSAKDKAYIGVNISERAPQAEPPAGGEGKKVKK